jgi:fructose-specific phosphotransferase system IIC component
VDLIYFILAAYGLTQILIFGSIFNKIRPSKNWLNGFGKLFHCPMCVGFWVGVFLFGINKWTELFTFEYTLANIFILGWLSSGACYLLSVLVNDFGFKITFKNEGDCNVN